MSVWRRWIFPALRVVLLAIVAIALIRIAFFPSAPEEEEVQPTGSSASPTTTVQRGSISTVVKIDAAVHQDPAQSGKAPLEGQVREIQVSPGQTVEKGARLAIVVQEIQQEPASPGGGEGEEAPQQPAQPKYRSLAVTAPVTGTVSSVPVVNNQNVAVGDTLVKVTPGTFSVKGTIKAADQYRLTSTPEKAQVALIAGPDPFECGSLRIGSAPAAEDTAAGDGSSGGEGGGDDSASGASVSCAVPQDVKVFSGLDATMELTGGSAEDALLLPVTAVRGNAQNGTVWVVGDKGDPVETKVKLGINDGEQIQITEGLKEGAEVLEFVPAGDPTDEQSDEGSGESDCFDENGEAC